MDQDPVELFERAATDAAALVGNVTDDARMRPTPCTDWIIDDLVTHMAGGPACLLDAMGTPHTPATDGAQYRIAVARCVEELRRPGALERRCMSPAGFEWSIAEATAGTFMDQLVHSWDLASALGEDPILDHVLVDACVAMFLPHVPDIGRGAGLVGPAVQVPDDASAQNRLLGAMGRRP